MRAHYQSRVEQALQLLRAACTALCARDCEQVPAQLLHVTFQRNLSCQSGGLATGPADEAAGSNPAAGVPARHWLPAPAGDLLGAGVNAVDGRGLLP